MVALTYSDAGVARVETASKTVAAAETQAPRKGFFGRFLEAMMEARMHQAQREIRLYTRLVAPAGLAADDKAQGGI